MNNRQNIMRSGYLALWLIVGISCGLAEEVKTPWTQTCRYVAQHDPVTIVVDEGRSYSVLYLPQSWNTVNAWVTGRKLRLTYTEDAGAALRDPVTELNLPLVGWADGGHPIDLILRTELSRTLTTLDECEAYERAANRWEREVVRAFDQLAKCPESGPDEAERVLEAKKAWGNYCSDYLKGVGATLSRRDGTIWSLVASRHRYTRMRQEAMLVYSLLVYAPNELMAEAVKASPYHP